MIGNRRDAEAAARGAVEPFGAGCSRIVYLINGVIYKVEAGHSESIDANLHELINWQRLKSMTLPSDIAIPDMTEYVINGERVLACEYIVGEVTGECFAYVECDCPTACLPRNIVRRINRLGIEDACYGNVILSNSKYFLVDLEV